MHLPRNTRGRQTQTHKQVEAGKKRGRGRGRGRIEGKRWGGWARSGGGVRGYHIYCSYRTAKAEARQLVQKFIETWNIVRASLTVLLWVSPSLMWVTSSPWTEVIGSTSSSLLLMSTFQVKVQINPRVCVCRGLCGELCHGFEEFRLHTVRIRSRSGSVCTSSTKKQKKYTDSSVENEHI